MKFLKNPFVIILGLLALAAGGYFLFAAQWKKYTAYKATRGVSNNPNGRPNTDPLWNATSILVAEKPDFVAGDTIEIERSDSSTAGRFMVLGVEESPLPGWVGYFIHTDAPWGHLGFFPDFSDGVGGKYRKI